MFSLVSSPAAATGTAAELRTGAAYESALMALAPHQRAEDITSAVFTAVRTRDLGVLKLLVAQWPAAAQAKFGGGGNDPTTPLHVAVSTSGELLALAKRLVGNTDTADEMWRWFGSLGGDVEAVRAEAGTGEVRVASLRPAVNLWSALFVEVLIEAGGQLSARDRLGRTPLHVACFLGNQHAATAMLNASSGAQSDLLDAVDAAGNTAMDLALLNGFAGTARMLKERWGASASRNTHAILSRMRNGVLEDAGSSTTGPGSDDDNIANTTDGWGGSTVGALKKTDSKTDRINSRTSSSSSSSRNASGVDVRSSIDWRVFTSEHLIPRRPLLFRGGCANWTQFRRVLARGQFLKAFGSRTLPFARCVWQCPCNTVA
jgi:hypothetical protein